ncbi:hypothetical protein Tco_1301785 [Tanacetum coccineum]
MKKLQIRNDANVMMDITINNVRANGDGKTMLKFNIFAKGTTRISQSKMNSPPLNSPQRKDQSLESKTIYPYRGRTQSLVAKKKDISENRASRNFDLMITKRKTFDHSRSSLGLHRNDVCSHQFRPRFTHENELELLFPPTSSNVRTTGTVTGTSIKEVYNLISQREFNVSRSELLLTRIHSFLAQEMDSVVRLGINPMIQPEPEDLPKDNPKLEIAVLRVILFSIHNDEWKSFQCHHQTALRSVINELTSAEIVSLNFIESIKEARSRVQDLTSGEIVSLNLLSRTRKLGHSTVELRSLIS